MADDRGGWDNARRAHAGPAAVRATLEVRRFDPETDREPHWRRYEVELPAGSTVLEALMYVQDELDGSLAFRRSCRHGICGSCGMRINGCARLACNTQLSQAVEEAVRARGHDWDGEPHEARVRIAPLGNMPVLKDLVTDMSAFWAKLRSVQPWLQPLDTADPDHERLMSPEAYGVMAQALLCVECGCCYSECCTLEVSEEFVGPAALAKAYRYAVDTRDDQTHRRIFDLSVEHGLWECTRCYYCTQRCPKHIRVRELITKLDQLAWAEGLRTDAGARRAAAVAGSVRESGRLDEVRLPLRTLGMQAALAKAPGAARAAVTGKLTPWAPAPVERLDELQLVIEAVEEQS